MLKIAGIVIGCLFGLVLLATILLLSLLEPYAERYLKKQVAERSQGLYQLEFEELDINLMTTSIRLHDVHLQPDSSVHRQQLNAGNASSSLLELKVPRLEIAGIGLLDLLFNNHLSIGSIEMESPVISLMLDERVAEENSNENKGLSNTLESASVGEIKISDATYRQLSMAQSMTPRHIVPHISLQIFDVQIDSLMEPGYLRSLKADDVLLAVKNYTFNSPDSVYDVHVELFTFSTKTKELLAEDVQIRADHEANTRLPPEEAKRFIYDIKAPRLLITGVDLLEAYMTKELQIDKLVLERALVDILENKNIPAGTEFPELSDLYENLSPFLKVISVNDLQVVDGALIYRNKVEEIVVIHELKKGNIALKSVQIDSSTLFTPREHSYAEEALIKAEGYTYKHPFSPYTIKLARLELSTRENHLLLDSIQIIGDRDKNERLKRKGQAQNLLYNIEAPNLYFTGMDLVAALQSGKLQIGRISMEDPNFELLRDREVEKAKSGSWLKDTYAAVSSYVNEVSIGEISLQKAFFTQHTKTLKEVRRSQRLEQASLRAIGVQVDSTFIFHSEAKLPLVELVLSAHSYTYWLPDHTHTFHLSSLDYSTRKQELRARAIDVSASPRINSRQKQYNNARPSLYDVSAPMFRVTGLDIIEALNKGRLQIDQLILREPELAITRDRDVAAPASDQSKQQVGLDVFELVDPITINTLRLEDGTFIYREKRDEIRRTHLLEHASATLKDVRIGPERIDELEEAIPIKEIVLTARDYTYQSPDSIYTITLDSLHYTSRQQLLTARRFDVVADKEMHQQLKEKNLAQASRNLFDISAEKYQISGLDLIKAYNTGNFLMQEMLLTEPQVSILQDRNVPDQGKQEVREENRAEAPSADEGGTREQIAEVVETFRVERVRVKDGSFTLYVLEDTVQRKQEVDQVSVAIAQLRLASLTAPDPLDMFRVDELGVVIQDYTFITQDSLYELSIKEVSSSLAEKSLHIDSLHLRPLLDRDQFVEELEYEDDQFEFTVPAITFLGIDFDALFSEQGIDADRLLVEDAIFEIYRDKRIPMDPERRPGTLQDALLEAGIYINIDTIDVVNGRLTYSEVAANGVEPGEVILDETRIRIFNVTNDSLLIQENNIATAIASTSFMKKSILQVDFKFYLDHPEDLHTYKGSLEPMDFEAFNPIVEKLMFIRVESGRINKAVFAVEATEHKAVGEMKFLYENLEIQLIDKEDPEKPGFLRHAGSWLINNLAVKDNNPGKLFNNLREGDIDSDRDYQKSVFNLMSSAMLNGIASSLMPALVETVVESTVGLP